ncbi:hypothetical protein HAHE_19090 [Haloferula helveola]|uniref:Uncharacterized protein n=1 Tax=Haloferula helveola TaxID=490095 RepID=A0ABN6H2X9_9BACT|nr:hypothetical protein HAHE_19090 [Haloferula helveola]
MAFLLFGVLTIVKPQFIVMSGGIGSKGSHLVTSFFGTKQSVAFGVVFVGISLVLFAVARRLLKDQG